MTTATETRYFEEVQTMTKQEYCRTHDSVAYYSGFAGLEIKGIEYSINDSVYCVSGAWTGSQTAHKLRIRYTLGGRAYVLLHGVRVPLDECIGM